MLQPYASPVERAWYYGMRGLVGLKPAGLFGTILPGGRVANLNVAGSVAAGGDKIACGGIAGENYGRIVCCTFTGMVQGDTQIGGIAGRNQASGQIVSCSFDTS